MLKLVIYFYILIIKFYNSDSIINTRTHVSDFSINNIIDLKSYQIVIFINNLSSNSLENNNVINNIALNNPLIIVDLKKVKAFKKNQFNKILQFIYRYKKSLLIIILQEKFVPEEIIFTLDLYTNLSRKYRRPRCLIISRDHLLSKRLIRSILYYGWLNKFLNLSIINSIIQDNQRVSKIFNYNPFFNVYNCEYYSLTTIIFPDKLNDMDGYILKVPYINAEPYFIKNIHINGIVTFSGTGYETLQFIESALNFKMDIVNTKNKNYTFAMNTLFNAEVNVAPFPLVITDALFNNTIEIGQPVSLSKSCGLYVAMRKTSVDISITTILPFTVSILIILIVTFMLNSMGIIKKRFSFFENLKILLGQPVKQPDKMSERIIFYSVALLSVIYFPDIIAQITGVTVAHDEQIISTYEDIIKFNMQPYTVQGFLELVIVEDNQFNDLIISKTILYSDPDTCFKLLQIKRASICFLAANRGKFFITRYKKYNLDIVLRMSDLHFASLPDAYFYESGSPFVEKFDLINQKILESGIKKYIFSKYLIPVTNERPQIDFKQNVASLQLIIIPIIGCIIACIVFIIEIIIRFLNIKNLYLK
jgi:hypothetical protein